jgi:hypothetical protein
VTIDQQGVRPVAACRIRCLPEPLDKIPNWTTETDRDVTRSYQMIILVAQSKAGYGVLVGSDLVEEFDQVDRARAYAAWLCDQAGARGESFSWVDVSEASTQAVIGQGP